MMSMSVFFDAKGPLLPSTPVEVQQRKRMKEIRMLRYRKDPHVSTCSKNRLPAYAHSTFTFCVQLAMGEPGVQLEILSMIYI